MTALIYFVDLCFHFLVLSLVSPAAVSVQLEPTPVLELVVQLVLQLVLLPLELVPGWSSGVRLPGRI